MEVQTSGLAGDPTKPAGTFYCLLTKTMIYLQIRMLSSPNEATP